jgi:branched-chain amino acid transport system ATP-binding protein
MTAASPIEPLLAVRALRSGYGPVEVLRGIDLAVSQGEIIALLGSNGAGKSTFINTVTGLIRPSAGQVRWLGQDVTGAGSPALVAAGLVQVPEGRRVFPDLSITDNLVLGSYRRGRPNRSANLERVMDTFPRLRERARQAAGTLSGGEQQMLAIGRALMAEPRLLILDEPSLGLAPRIVEDMFELILRLNREGLTILLVEQNVAQSLEIAHCAHVMENGSLQFSGSRSELLASEQLRRAYLGL